MPYTSYYSHRHHVFSHSAVAYICVFWEEQVNSRAAFDGASHSYRGYDLVDEQRTITSVPEDLVLQRAIPDSSMGFTVSLLFISGHRSGCFAVSDQPSLSQLQASLLGGGGPIKLASPIAYHIGVRLGLWLAHFV